MRISDWSSDVCSSDLLTVAGDACLHPFLQFERIGRRPRPVAMREHDLSGRQLGVESSRTLGELARLDLRIAKRDRLREFARSRIDRDIDMAFAAELDPDACQLAGIQNPTPFAAKRSEGILNEREYCLGDRRRLAIFEIIHPDVHAVVEITLLRGRVTQ